MILDLTNDPSQTFSSIINEVRYDFKINWNSRFSFWTISVNENEGIKIVAGVDILRPFPQLPFGLQSNDITDPSRFNLNEFILEVLEDV